MASGHYKFGIDALAAREKLAAPRILVWMGTILCVYFCLLHIYWAISGAIDPYAQRFICLSLLLLVGILTHPTGRKSWSSALNGWFVVDVLMFLFVAGTAIYVLYDFDSFIQRTANISTLDTVLMSGYLLVLLEMTRRTAGWILVALPIFFLAQNTFGPYLPWILQGPAIHWQYEIQIVMMQGVGIFGTPIQVITDLIVPFMILVAALTRSGAMTIFIDLAMSIAGGFSGGPAKVAVIGSSLFGTMTGSAIANVAGIGAFTIPLMKSYGFRPSVAGAIEACSSTGGQIMPPVMGTAAFLMAEFLGISYWYICLIAIIPAVIFYTAIFTAVHFEAKRTGLAGLPRDMLPPLKVSLKRAWPILAPIALLMFLLAIGYGPGMAALLCTALTLILTYFRKETRITAYGLLALFEDSVRMVLTAAIAIGAIGIIIGTFYVSGFGTYFALLVERLSMGIPFLALVLCAIACTVLGMGLPTAPVYIMAYILIIPALVNMGLNVIAVHFFCIWYGILAPLTPPVGLAFMTAAPIAGCKPMECGWQSTRLGLVFFLLPFSFALEPAILLQGSPISIVIHSLSAFISAIVLAGGLQGFFFYVGKLGKLDRLVVILCGCGLLAPSSYVNLGSSVVLVSYMLIMLVRKKVMDGRTVKGLNPPPVSL